MLKYECPVRKCSNETLEVCGSDLFKGGQESQPKAILQSHENVNESASMDGQLTPGSTKVFCAMRNEFENEIGNEIEIAVQRGRRCFTGFVYLDGRTVVPAELRITSLAP